VTVRLAFDPGQVSLCVADNGIGFDSSTAAGKGFGLLSMRDRMTALHGSLEILADPAGGITLMANAPVRV
jgi:signal transduction histidine kinase